MGGPMNFEFSEDSQLLRDQARSFLAEKCASKVVRAVLEGREAYARDLWLEMAAMGWPGVAIAEPYGGAGLGYEGLCVLAEELGRACAPVPFASSVYLATEAILASADETQKRDLLPKLADGSLIGTFAFAEGFSQPSPDAVTLRAAGGMLTGSKWPVPDGNIADFAIVVARDERGIALYRVDLNEATVSRRLLQSIDPSRGQAKLDFAGARAERLGGAGDGWPVVQRLLERAAILVAFEQVGGAERCLDMARDYAKERFAFGRPIGSFQAIKHKLADVYVALELARSNAYYGAWALAAESSELPLAAATARVAATEAFHLASKETIQTHGGVGFTWDFDCHLYYRRSKHLALTLGGAPYWKSRLVDQLETRNAA